MRFRIMLARILRDSWVWIPCNAALGEEDTNAFLEMLKEAGDDLESLEGKNLCTSEKIRMIPDILQNGDDFFFSSAKAFLAGAEISPTS